MGWEFVLFQLKGIPALYFKFIISVENGIIWGTRSLN